jgi:predicted transcriptional regulator
MRELEKILKALANKRRLAILKYLKNKNEAAVWEISNAINLSFKATSKHLGILSAIDILEKDQRSLQMYYRLAANQKPIVRYTINFL